MLLPQIFVSVVRGSILFLVPSWVLHSTYHFLALHSASIQRFTLLLELLESVLRQVATSEKPIQSLRYTAAILYVYIKGYKQHANLCQK